MTFAVIQTGGKQYKVAVGDILDIEKLDAAEGSEVTFSEVLLTADDKDISVGQPLVAKAKVTAQILEQGKGEKKIVFRFKAKTRYRKKKGHRQPFTKVKITNISA
ncbi:MAG: 50S ribosomal protein L21 [Candidatus Paceibacterota bacterium]|nr:MAG: 50S ribosomal protein L21 [Candidatus Paceibacterota bacterium]